MTSSNNTQKSGNATVPKQNSAGQSIGGINLEKTALVSLSNLSHGEFLFNLKHLLPITSSRTSSWLIWATLDSTAVCRIMMTALNPLSLNYLLFQSIISPFHPIKHLPQKQKSLLELPPWVILPHFLCQMLMSLTKRWPWSTTKSWLWLQECSKQPSWC